MGQLKTKLYRDEGGMRQLKQNYTEMREGWSN
jgi:hypothetical protein